MYQHTIQGNTVQAFPSRHIDQIVVRYEMISRVIRML